MKDLEKRLDIDSFEQVPEDSSQRPTQEHSAETSVQRETSGQPGTSVQQKDFGSKSIFEDLTQTDTNVAIL